MTKLTQVKYELPIIVFSHLYLRFIIFPVVPQLFSAVPVLIRYVRLATRAHFVSVSVALWLSNLYKASCDTLDVSPIKFYI